MGPVTAITLFVEDLPGARAFYQRVFEAPPVFEDTNSAVFDAGGTLVNLLMSAAAAELVEPLPVGGAGSGARSQLTITVDDVDAVVAGLREREIELVNGPMDRPWGVRTAAFADPAGHVWEVAQQLAG
jgi:catechol 2,3-dioxygenase-like lactoylglutathione lyase family enzyme